MANSVLYNKVKKQNQDSEIKSLEVLTIDGELYVTSSFIQVKYNVTSRQLTNWKSKGFEHSNKSIGGEKGTKLYSLSYLLKWHEENINKTKSNATNSRRDPPTTPPQITADLELEHATKEEADRLLQIEKVKIERIKHLELRKELIPAEDTDKAMAELGAIHVSQYQSDLKLLPILLEDKSKQAIAGLLDDHYKSRVEDMNTIVNKVKLEEERTIFEALWDFARSIV